MKKIKCFNASLPLVFPMLFIVLTFEIEFFLFFLFLVTKISNLFTLCIILFFVNFLSIFHLFLFFILIFNFYFYFYIFISILPLLQAKHVGSIMSKTSTSPLKVKKKIVHHHTFLKLGSAVFYKIHGNK